MQLGRVDGVVNSVTKHPSLIGWRLLIYQPIDGNGVESGSPQIALDPLGAGVNDRVIVSSDGKATRQAVNDPDSPARNMVVGIVNSEY